MTNLQLQLVPRNDEQETILNSLSTYTEKYNFIVDHYKKFTEKLDCYCEVHHIIPRSCKGTDNPDNLVKLPAAIHYIVHFLLPMVMDEQNNEHGKRKMLHAFNMFSAKIRKNHHLDENIVSIIAESEEYAMLRKLASENSSAFMLELNSDPEYRKRNSERQKKRYEEHPELREECSIRAKKWMREKPESVKRMMEGHIIAMKRPEVRNKMRETAKARYENPETKQRQREAQIRRYSNPEERKKLSLRKLGVPMSDEAKEAMSKAQSKRFESQEERMKCSLPGEKNGMYGRRGENSVPHQMHWIKNETTGESKYVWKSEPIPDGWTSGRFNPYDRTGLEKCWITNGTEDKLVPKDKPIPDGWRHGMSFSSRPAYGKTWITNGTENALIDKDSPIPEGWHRGQSKSKPTGGAITKGMFWINNGVEQRLSKGDIPDGWARGRIKLATGRQTVSIQPKKEWRS